MAIQIPQYETKHQANPPMAPTLTFAPGEQLGRAVAGFGESVSGFAANMMKVQDRNGKLEAAKILSQVEVDVQEQLMKAGDELGSDNPEGFAGQFNEQFSKSREFAMREAEKSSKNPYVSRYLKEGFDNLQRNTFVNAMKVERGALQKYGEKQATDYVTAKVKLAGLRPENAADLMANVGQYIGEMKSMPAQWRAEVTTKAASAIGEAAMMSMIKADPVGAAAVIADKENPITAALSADAFMRLKPAAENASIDFQGRTNGRALAAEAFRLQDPTLIDKAIEKIADPDMRDRTEKYAQAEYNGMVAQKNHIENTHKKNEYDIATRAALDGVPYQPTGNITSSYEQQQVVEYYQRMREQMLYQKEGGALSDDVNYVTEIQAMLYSGDKTAILGHFLDRTRLKESTFKTFNGAIERIKGDRNTRISDVGQYVDRAMVSSGLTSDADKRRASIYKMVLLDRVAQKEAELKRPLQDAELRQLATDVFSQKYETQGFFGREIPAVRAVPPQAMLKISAALRGTTTPADPATIAAIYHQIRGEARPTLERLIREENPDADITDDMLIDRGMQAYVEQYRQQ